LGKVDAVSIKSYVREDCTISNIEMRHTCSATIL